MTFDQLWEHILVQNPSLSDGKAFMSTENFKKAIKLSYDTGRKSRNLKDSLGYKAGSLFEDIFGKKG